MKRIISGKGLIDRASSIGEHAIEFRQRSLVMADMGGLFVDASVKELTYGKDLQTVEVSRGTNEGRFRARGFSSGRKQVFAFSCGAEKMFHLLGGCEYLEHFMTFTDLTNLKAVARANVLLGEKAPDAYTLVRRGQKVDFVRVGYENGYICLGTSFDETEKISLSTVEEIQNEVHMRQESISSIRTAKGFYELIRTADVGGILDKVEDDLANLRKIGDLGEQIILRGAGEDFFAYRSGECLKIYEAGTLSLRYEFEISNTSLYLGSRYIILQHENDTICSSNEHVKTLCAKTGIGPARLHVLTDARMIARDGQKKFEELLLFSDECSWYMYDPKKDRMIRERDHEEIHRSSEDPRIILLNDGLLFSETPVELFGKIGTPTVLMTYSGFPVFFERREIRTVRMSIPGKVLWEGTTKAFYDARTRQVEGDVVVDLGAIGIRMPIDMYKATYRQSLLDLKAPSLSDFTITTLMTSRARNLSDMLIYEFFGQWQILLDYMSSFMDEEKFSKDEMTNYGLFMYHAIYQQRKRMEEVSSKFPYFMSTLASKVGVSSEGNHIYQKQQRQLFQLSAQLKSQFIELENLLSQVTYVHVRNDEYQKRMDLAYKENNQRKLGGALIAGIGVTVLTGGLGLILPAKALFSGWSDAKQREELTKIQAEKEFDKNEFLFKKAVDLIRHMNAFTIDHHVDLLNQFTFEILQLEAREIMRLEPSHQQRERLLEQSVQLYTKNALPIDFSQGVVPQRIITSILEKPSKKDEGIESLFLD